MTLKLKSGRRALIADDDPTIRKVMRAAME